MMNSLQEIRVNRLFRIAIAGFCLSFAAITLCQTTTSGKTPIMLHAKGTFDVKMAPTGHAPDESIGSFSSVKQFHGDLEATSKGEMLSVGNPSQGDAAYVAMERVTGTLGGKTGSFALYHVGTFVKGTPQLAVTVAPGSGTGELTGISGTLTIIITDGKHSYTFDYTVPEAK